MDKVKEVIKQLDFFSHGQFLRYRNEQGYRTLTGGVLSIALIALFIGLFSSFIFSTFSYTIINTKTQQSYETDPLLYELQTGSKFMFAVGITSLDLSSSTRYFDVTLSAFSSIKNVINGSTTTTTEEQVLQLQPCRAQTWSQFNSDIKHSFQKIKLNQWLCPKKSTIMQLQGKYTSDIFKYSKISVSACKQKVGEKSCANASQIQTFLQKNQGMITTNLYFTNTVINSGSEKYLDYYLEDKNYFRANANLGVQANIFFTEYDIVTDKSILPWQDLIYQKGVYVTSLAEPNIYPIDQTNTSPIYTKIYFRKASDRLTIERSFQKLDDTLSYIGGLFGIIMILFILFSVYDKFGYQIEFGDRSFKQENMGSYGSEHFNFVVFLGYGFFQILKILGCSLNWQTMKRYHECRMESRKQLDVQLLFKKISFLEEVAQLVLEQHHLKGLHMLPKPTLKQVQQTRRTYNIKTILYRQLQKKGRDIYIQKADYNIGLRNFITNEQISPEIKKIAIQENNNEIRKMSKSYQLLQQDYEKGDHFSVKILDRFQLKKIFNVILKLAQEPIKDTKVGDASSQANLNSREQMPHIVLKHTTSKKKSYEQIVISVGKLPQGSSRPDAQNFEQG